jgi:CBS domain-containing protein
MATVRAILEHKGRQAWTVEREATVIQAVLLMNDHKVGGLIVLDDGQIAGMFTERDLLRRVVGEQRDPARTNVADVMTAEVVCCHEETTLEEARGVMKNRRFRHLPVVDGNGQLIGLISIGDLNAQLQVEQERTILLLNEYMYGRV